MSDEQSGIDRQINEIEKAFGADLTAASELKSLDSRRKAMASTIEEEIQREPLSAGVGVGIDLGTTYSALAFLDSQGKPEMIRSVEGELTTPSVVYFDSGQPIVGQEALRAAEFDPGHAVRFAKRSLGRRYLPTEIKGIRIPPEVVEACVLRKLKQDAEMTLGRLGHAVLAVPANFDDSKRKATLDAGYLAGFQSLEIINEPTAAAIAYGVRAGFRNADAEGSKSGLPNKELVLVYDLGGGTFDVTIMEIDGTQFDSIATAGDLYLGGMDWDKRLVDHLADFYHSKQHVDLRENQAVVAELYREVERVKKTLSFRKTATARLGISHQELRVDVRREEFEQMTTDLRKKTLRICNRLLFDCGLEWSDLNRVLLVGGSTRMPAIQRILSEASGLLIDRSLAPDEAVAQGAALYAGVRHAGVRHAGVRHAGNRPGEKRQYPGGSRDENEKIQINNVNAYDLGVLGKDRRTGQVRRQIMIPRNSKLPAISSKRFLTARQGQKSVVVSIVEGGTNLGRNASHIGICKIMDLPDSLPKGSCIKVTFRYTKDGRLAVDALIPDIGCQARTVIHRGGGLCPEERDFWRQIMDRGLDLGKFASRLNDGLVQVDDGPRKEPISFQAGRIESNFTHDSKSSISTTQESLLLQSEENRELDELFLEIDTETKLIRKVQSNP